MKNTFYNLSNSNLFFLILLSVIILFNYLSQNNVSFCEVGDNFQYKRVNFSKTFGERSSCSSGASYNPLPGKATPLGESENMKAARKIFERFGVKLLEQEKPVNLPSFTKNQILIHELFAEHFERLAEEARLAKANS